MVDYRGLNRITKRNNAAITRTDEMFDRLERAKWFSKLDLKTGFHQIRVQPSDVEKTAFKTKHGHFEYVLMPMGLCNAPATFQTLMSKIFYDCIDDFLVVYIDDLLIYSETEDERLRHLEAVLSRLAEHELYVGCEKCKIMARETEFLGLVISDQGIQIGQDRVEAIRAWPKPRNIHEVRSFIELAQFLRRFVKDFSVIAAPLTDLTRKGIAVGKWDKSCDKAFALLKEALCSAPILMPPDWMRPFRCHVDASQFGVGGTLTQLDKEDHERVIAYFSRRLS